MAGDYVSIQGQSTNRTTTAGGKPLAEPIKSTGNSLHVVEPISVSGSVARYHVADQSTSRTRIELPTGAKSIRIFYNARMTGATVRNATGELLKVVFNISGTTEAGNALAESASSSGGTLSGVSYLPIPINSVYEQAYPDPLDRLLYVDFLTAVAETGDSDVIVEVVL